MKKSSSVWMVLVGWSLATQWLQAGWEKWTKPEFMTGIAKTLGLFAAKTPYRWYSSFVTTYLLPHASWLGNVVRASELLIGLDLVLLGVIILGQHTIRRWVATVMTIACYGAALLSLNFYLAAAWSGPSTAGLNVVMGLVEAILGTYYLLAIREAGNHKLRFF